MKNKIISIIPWVVIITGLVVIIGWVFNIEAMKSVVPGTISMKFTTAVSFVISGILLLLLGRNKKNPDSTNQLAITICAGLLILVMATFLLSFIFNVPVGLESLVIKEPVGTAATIFPGRPSLSTMTDFVLIAIAGILLSRKIKRSFPARLLGWVIALMGISVIIGYIFNVPPLYFYFENVSNGMAVNTAVLFILIGTAFILLEKLDPDDVWPTAMK